MGRSSSRRPPAGFSVLNALVATLLLGLLLAIAIPSLQGFRLSRLLTAAQQEVATILLRARWMAITSGQTRTVNLAGSTQLLVLNGGTTLASAQLGGYSVTQTHTGNDTFNLSNRGLVPSGTTAPITITLTNPRGVTKTVTIDRLGRVQAP